MKLGKENPFLDKNLGFPVFVKMYSIAHKGRRKKNTNKV